MAILTKHKCELILKQRKTYLACTAEDDSSSPKAVEEV